MGEMVHCNGRFVDGHENVDVDYDGDSLGRIYILIIICKKK